jgi:hypothetical protein
LGEAVEARAFNWALRTFTAGDWAYIGKLDGDVELPPQYFERLLARLAKDPDLGIVGGRLVEWSGSAWKPIPIPSHHVHGAVKLYRRACFEAIGGIQERLAWDTIDETYARMRRYLTHSYEDVAARHLRPYASAGGTLRGRARHGRCAYILHYSLPWVGLRSLKLATARPRGISGIAFLFGYLAAAARSEPRVPDEEFRRFARRGTSSVLAACQPPDRAPR